VPFAKAMDAADYRPSKRADKVHQVARTETCGDLVQLTAGQCVSAVVHWFLSKMCSVYRVRVSSCRESRVTRKFCHL